VAGAAFNFVMRGLFPALVKGLHVMTGIAESGMRSVFDRTDQKNKDEANAREDDYSLYFLLLVLLFLHLYYYLLFLS
jgi:hypothetical protein